MEYTRAELIEDEKVSIDIMIDEARMHRDFWRQDDPRWDYWDGKIDSLLALKDEVAEKYDLSQSAAAVHHIPNSATNGTVRFETWQEKVNADMKDYYDLRATEAGALP